MTIKFDKLVLVFTHLLLFCTYTNIKAFILDKSGNYAILRGSSLRMNCIPKNTEHVEIIPGSSYLWTDEEGREVIDARFTKMENGDMEIVNAHVGDSGVYKCKLRPPFATDLSKIYEHKLVVYELSGHKFVSTVYIDMTDYSVEIMTDMLKNLLSITVCKRDLCIPGNIKSVKCEQPEIRQKMCEFTIAYEAVNEMADERCDEECVRERMFDGLKKAERVLELELLKSSENHKGRVKADMKTFDTKHLITCRAGFHLIKAHFKRCFPCLPGYYSEPNSVKCSMCNIGSYQEHYGKRDCDKCEQGKTTDTMGSKSRDDCIPTQDTGIIGDIKQGLLSIFAG